ncbi:extracellular solute-binding protein [Actinospica sp. MGRD01-02]|uniref:Extracellular solute-binding protein n=1 Tax=Actinospica acidithermotolerans TaxID=2828514 RepID=A0A941E7C2_9ACTN|nr:extracellular solute-binding protein [Actinospica acidithermotolerans]MBR7825142.1 extracellular solute-binding protein [Actinospica acidithermotolerans]
MRKRWIAAAAGVAAAATFGLSGCSSSGTSGTSGSTQGPASGPVSLTFWGWAPGYQQSVALWNKSHPDIQIDWETVAPGSKGGYTKMLTAVKAGNAPCLAQVGYETLPSFAAAGALQDVTQYASPDQGQFAAWTWNQVTIEGKTYGIPVDAAPMALLYNKTLFAKYGITAPPATWAEYSADAAKIHQADPKVYIGYFGNDAYNYAGLDWQDNAPWFTTPNSSWRLGFTSSAGEQVASYWQGLVSRHLLSTDQSYSPSLYKDMAAGRILSDVNAVWDAPLLASSVGKSQSGQWAVAPMPVWNASAPAYGNDGGSATAVLNGCKDPQQATEFADWMSTDSGSVTNLIDVTGIYPAATSGLSNPALSAPNAYYGNQVVYDVFKAEMPQINTSWLWGPTMTQVSTDLGNDLGSVETGSQTVAGMLGDVQSKTAAQLTQQGISVSGG